MAVGCMVTGLSFDFESKVDQGEFKGMERYNMFQIYPTGIEIFIISYISLWDTV